MPDIKNGQHWLDRNRPPRVQITYDVEVGDAIEKKELPLVVGILAGLGGETRPALPLAERSFVDIDRDNFDKVLEDIAPTVSVVLQDSANAAGSTDAAANSFTATLTFKSIEDFNPVNIVKRVTQLNELYEIRLHLRDMLARLDGNVQLDVALSERFKSTGANGNQPNNAAAATGTGTGTTGAATGTGTGNTAAATGTGTGNTAAATGTGTGNTAAATGTGTGDTATTGGTQDPATPGTSGGSSTTTTS